MTDGVICDRCGEATESDEFEKRLSATVESTCVAENSLMNLDRGGEYDLCENCTITLYEFLGADLPKGYADDSTDEDDLTTDELYEGDDPIGAGAVVEWSGYRLSLALTETYIEPEGDRIDFAEFAGYVEGAEEVNDE